MEEKAEPRFRWLKRGVVLIIISVVIGFVAKRLWWEGESHVVVLQDSQRVTNSEIVVQQNMQSSPGGVQQNMENSPGGTQLAIEHADQVAIKVSPKLERKLTMRPVHVNKPVGNKFESLYRGTLEAPYPIPSLRVEAFGSTVQEVDLSPMRTGIVMKGHTGKREDHAFTTLQNAIGKLQLRVVTLKPEELEIRFSVPE